MTETPPSRRIAEALRQAIQAGELAPGAQLPSERELARQYGAARNTARQAIAILQAEGLVEAQHGRGAFVRVRAPLMRLGHDRYSRRHRETGMTPFRAEIERQGRQARVEVPEVATVAAPPEVAERLVLKVGEPILRRRNHYFADDQLVFVGRTYVPLGIAADSPLLGPELGPGGIYARLEDLGHVIARSQEYVTSRMPSAEETAEFGLPPGVPVVEVLHTSVDQDGRPFEVTHFVLPADRNALSYEVPVD